MYKYSTPYFNLSRLHYIQNYNFSDHHNLLLLASVSETDLPSDPKKPFRCTYCRKEFAHLTSLESHMEQVHKGEAKHKCEVCDRSFSSKSNLTAHRKIHSGKISTTCFDKNVKKYGVLLYFSKKELGGFFKNTVHLC